MFPVAKHFDPQLGIDIHSYSAPPGPWPTLHIGMLFDPFDLLPTIHIRADNPVLKAVGDAMGTVTSVMDGTGLGTTAPEPPGMPDLGEGGEETEEEKKAEEAKKAEEEKKAKENPPDIPIPLGATLKICGVRRAMASTMGFDLHILIGVPTPPPKAPGGEQFDNELFMGHLRTLCDSEPLSHLLSPVLSCSVVGMIPPIRLKQLIKKGAKVTTSLTLPTVITLALMSNVYVGLPPMISWSALMFKAALKGLGKALKGLGKVYKAVARRVFKNMDSGFLKCKILRAEPVDIRDGSVSVEHLDFEIPGRLPLTWVRNYSSTSEDMGVCGHGWDTLADLRLELLEDGSVSFWGPRQVALFPHLPAGGDEAVLDIFDGARLSCEPAQWVVQTKDGLRYRFLRAPQAPVARPGVFSKIERIEDACGNHWRFEWSGKRLTRIVESAPKGCQGRVIEVQSSAEGLIETMTLIDPATGTPRRLVAYRFARGDLEAAVDAHGDARRFAYEAHRMVSHTDRNALSFHYAYDNKWRVVHAWGDGGEYDYRFAYNELLRETEITDSLGHTTVIKLDENNLPLCEIDPLGGVTIFEYDEAGRTVAVTAPEGLCTRYEYDAYGNLLNTVLPDGSAVSAAFNEDHKPVSMTDPEGGQWTQEWDAQGNLIRQTTPSGTATQYEYSEQGDLVRVTDPTGQCTTLDYDPLGFLAGLTDAMGQRAQFQHDAQGNLLAKQLANGDTTHYRYDVKNRLVESALPDAKRIHCAYDSEDNLTCYKDEAGRETHFTYYCQGSLQSRTDPDGSRVEYHYDTEEQLIGVTNQHGKRWHLKRDALGRLIEEIDYWGQSRQYGYDAAGYLAKTTDPLGQTLKITCDQLGRIISKETDQETETYEYNKRGQLTEAKNPFSKIERKYNKDGQLTKEAQQQADLESEITYTYNPAGQLIKQIQQAQHHAHAPFKHIQQYTYNALGQPETIQIDDHAPIRFTFDTIGRLKTQHHTEHLIQHYQYNPTGQLTNQASTYKGQLQTRIDYDYDEAGNLIQRDDHRTGTDHYRYDLLGQITHHTDPTGKLKQFVYDKTGNRFKTSQEDETGRTLQHDDGSYWRLDKAGQLIQKRDAQGQYTHLEWDAFGRLRKLTTPSKDQYEYRYDALSRRVCKAKTTDPNHPTEITWFMWDGDVMVGEVKQSANEAQSFNAQFYSYHLGSFVPLAMQVQTPEKGGFGKKLYFYQNDPNGMPLRLQDVDGVIAWEGHYSAFGLVDWVGVEKVTQPLRLLGQYFDDESDLYYNRYRYFDASVGCFISSDPIRLLGGINPYQFAPNVFGWVDPWGLATVDTTFEMGGHLFTGVNPTERANRVARKIKDIIEGIRLGFVNGNTFSMHAEIDAMLKAYEKGLKGGKGVLIIDNLPACGFCRRSLKNMANALKLDEFIVIEKATGLKYTFDRSKGDLNPMRAGGKGFKECGVPIA